METTLPEAISELRVRPARPSDMPWLVARFPWAIRQPSQAHFTIAENEKRSPVGGCYFTMQKNQKGEQMAIIDLQIISEDYLRTVTSALLQTMRRRAWTDGLKNIVHRGIWEGSPLEKVLQEENFQLLNFVTHYEVDVATFWKEFDTTFQRLQKRGKISESARVMPLREAPLVSVGELIRRTIGGDAVMMEKQFGAKQFSEEYSQVVQVGPTITAAILVHVEKQIPEVSYMAIDKKWRNSWIYAGLIRELVRKLMEGGHTTFRYKTNPGNNRAPTNTGKRLEGKVLGREIHYQLDPGPETLT